MEGVLLLECHLKQYLDIEGDIDCLKTTSVGQYLFLSMIEIFHIESASLESVESQPKRHFTYLAGEMHAT